MVFFLFTLTTVFNSGGVCWNLYLLKNKFTIETNGMHVGVVAYRRWWWWKKLLKWRTNISDKKKFFFFALKIQLAYIVRFVTLSECSHFKSRLGRGLKRNRWQNFYQSKEISYFVVSSRLPHNFISFPNFCFLFLFFVPFSIGDNVNPLPSTGAILIVRQFCADVYYFIIYDLS